MAAPALQAAGAALGARVAAAARARGRGARAARAAAADRGAARAAVVERRVGPDGVPDGIPAAFVPIYRESAARVRPQLARCSPPCTSEETGFSTHPTTYHGLNSAGCCAGPFQFNVTNGPPSTWDGHKCGVPARPPAGPLPAPAGAAPVGLRRLRRRHGRRLAAARQRRRRARSAPARSRPCAPTTAPARSPRPTPAACSTAPAAGKPRSAGPGRRHAPAAPGGGELSWPVRGPVVSPFGMRWGRLHAGIDIAAPTGTPILAAATGRVTTRGWVAGYGLLTCLEHTPPSRPATRTSRGWARRRPAASSPRGALVGLVGCTGHCFGPHLHFEVRISGRARRPAPLPRAEAADGARAAGSSRRCSPRSSRAARTPTSQDTARRRRHAPTRARPARGRRAPAAAPRARDTARTVATDAQATRRVPPSTRSARSGRTGTGARSSASSAGSRAWRPAPLARQLAAEARLRAQDQVVAPRPSRRARARRRDRRQARRARRATRSASHGKQPLADGRADLEGARHRVYLATVARTRCRLGGQRDGSRSPSRPHPPACRDAHRT